MTNRIDIENALTRRRALQAAATIVAGLGLAPAFWRTGRASAAVPVSPGNGPYGPLQAADANGIMLPKGFSSRVIAQGRVPVSGTTYTWHDFSDGAATYATPDGGWIFVNNSETTPQAGGGASAIRFKPDGSVADAYRVLGNTSTNCAGGRTPWATWLSCEETDDGQVWECDPTGSKPAVARPAMGRFNHEAAAVDATNQHVYLTEDEGDGGFYRFTPASYPDLSAGLLEVAIVAADGRVSWVKVPDPLGGAANPTRKQVPGMTQFKRGEGIWFDAGIVYVATTSDSKLHAYDTSTKRLTVVYDKAAIAEPPLLNLDNVTVSPSGDIFVGEDDGGDDPLDLGIITPEGEVARFLKLTGPQHGSGDATSEVTGPVFDPSGKRLYFSSQRAFGLGQVYEITGPFRTTRPAAPPVGSPPGTKRPGGTTGGGTAGGGATGSGAAAQDLPRPLLGVEVPTRRTRKTIYKHGLPVALTLDTSAKVTVTVRAAVNAGGRRKTVTLARLSREIDAGPELLKIKLDRSARDRLRRRRSTRVTVEVAIGGRTLKRTLTVTAA